MSMAAVLQTATDGELEIMEAALVRVSKASGAPSVAERLAWLEEHLSAFEMWAAKMKKAQAPWYDALEAEVLNNLGATSKAVGDEVAVLLFDEDAASEALDLALRPLYLDAYEQLGLQAIASVKGGIAFDIQNPRALAELAKREVLMKTVAADAQTRLRDSIAAGMKSGETVKDLTARVKEWAVTGRESYAENVARTETGSALNRGAQEGYKQAGCTVKTWLSVVDDRSRTDHAAIDGVSVDFEEGTFGLASGSWDGPHDPGMGPEDVCNCRCTVIGGFGKVN